MPLPRRILSLTLAAAISAAGPALAGAENGPGDGNDAGPDEAIRAAADALCPPCDKDNLLRIAPADSEAIIVVNNGARQRRSTAGRALQSLLGDAAALPETREAWGQLAATLGWSSEQAFDELLGQRTTLVMRGLDDPARTQWVVLSEVSSDTERRLRARLRPAPRGHVAGLLSLSVENGRYELVLGPSGMSRIESPASADADAAQAGNTHTGNTMILLGPGGNNQMMADLAPMLLRAMPATPPGPGGRECDFVVILRQKPSPAASLAGEKSRGRFLLLTGTLEGGDGWNISLAASPGMVWEQPRRLERIRPWSDSGFQMLEKDALLAIMGVIGSTRLESLSAVHALSGIIPIIPFALEGEPFGQRAAIYIREAAGRSSVRGTVPITADANPRARLASTTPQHDIPSGSHEGGRLTVGLAIETTDTRKMMVEGDQMIARLMRFLESGDLPRDQAPRVQLVVTVPETETRALRLDGSRPINAAIANGLSRAFGLEPLVSWGIRALPQSTPDGARPGWWVAAMSPGDTSVVTRDAAALASTTGGAALPRLSVGVIRPAALERAFSDVDPTFLAPLRAMRRIDYLHWDAWQLSDGTVEASIQLRMRKQP